MRSVSNGTFWEHLEELRKRLLTIIVALAATTVISFIFSRSLMGLVLGTAPRILQAIAPAEAVIAHLKLSLTAGVLVASPVVFFQLWRFIAPGLYDSERRTIAWAAAASALLFCAGAVFAWLVMLRPTLELFRSFESGRVVGVWTLENYIGFLGRFVLVFGIAFQMPLLIHALVSLGVVDPGEIGRYRRHVVVALLILAALLTPPDPVTQVMLSLPLYLLFELSLLTARLTRAGKPSTESRHLPKA